MQLETDFYVKWQAIVTITHHDLLLSMAIQFSAELIRTTCFWPNNQKKNTFNELKKSLSLWIWNKTF